MTHDEQAIRQSVADWQRYTRSGDVERVTDDVVFTVVGCPPFGKAQLARDANLLGPPQP